MENNQLEKLMFRIIRSNPDKLWTCKEIVRELPKHSFSTNDFHNTLTKLCHDGKINRQKINYRYYYWYRRK